MGPSLSLWLYKARARLTETDPATALSNAPPKGGAPLVWLHCPDAGAASAMSELVRFALDENPNLDFLLTHPDETPPAPLAALAQPGIALLPLPADSTANARALIQDWQPKLALFSSDALPPAMISEAARARIPMCLFADDHPERGVPAAIFRRRLANAVLHKFRRIFLISPTATDPLRRLGIPATRMELTGPLSDGAPVLPCNEADHDAMARYLAGRPSWLAMGVTPSETPIAVAAHASAELKSHRLLMVLVPDDPGRGPALAQQLRADGWRVALRSDGDDPTNDTQIFIADLGGEEGLWYRLAPITFVGRTHSAGTPPDPFAPAALGSALLHGPRTGPMAARFAQLGVAGAAREVSDDKSLGLALTQLLSPETSAKMAHSGWDVASRGAQATARVTAWMLNTLSTTSEAP